ncbi:MULTISPECIES: TolC family protein [unclassified Mannheimia]|uniref:TolC family protein n=1 Tax=unclassified Mannheimia TaxID=2645054 RepID=UPI00359E5E2B
MKKLLLLVSSATFLSACSSQNQHNFEVSGQACSICSADGGNSSASLPVSTPNTVKSPSLQSQGYNSFLSIINSALEYNQNVSSLPSVIEQRKAEAEIIRKNNWPSIRPVARYSSQTSPYIGANASYTLWDFGSAKHKEKQGELGVDNSQLEFFIEEREVIASTVEAVVKISSLVENSKLLSSSIASISKLSGLADVRFEAGMSTASESNTLNLRLAELKSELDAINIEIALNLDLLSAKLMSPITLNDIPSLYSITSQILPDLGNESLQLRQAEINKEIAYAQFQQAESDIYPHLVLEGEVGKATNGSSVHTVGVSFQLPTSVFARSATVNAAESAYKAANRKVTQIETQLETENKRIELETNRLNNNKNTLLGLEKKGMSAIGVFDSEFEAGTATLSDGLSAHRTLLQTRQQLISLQAQLLNLKASKIRITNGSIFNTSE